MQPLAANEQEIEKIRKEFHDEAIDLIHLNEKIKTIRIVFDGDFALKFKEVPEQEREIFLRALNDLKMNEIKFKKIMEQQAEIANFSKKISTNLWTISSLAVRLSCMCGAITFLQSLYKLSEYFDIRFLNYADHGFGGGGNDHGQFVGWLPGRHGGILCGYCEKESKWTLMPLELFSAF